MRYRRSGASTRGSILGELQSFVLRYVVYHTVFEVAFGGSKVQCVWRSAGFLYRYSARCNAVLEAVVQ
jgi:hypothetical protein